MFDCLTTIWIKYSGRLVKSYILIILGCDPLVIKSCWFDIGKNKLVNLFPWEIQGTILMWDYLLS